MKTQVTSILLCALLCSTLGHEYLSAKRLAPESKSKHPSALSHFEERDAGQEVCEIVCEDNKTDGLQIAVNETTNLIGIVNATAKVALIIDINANLVGLLNGTTGAIVIINIQTGTGVYIAANQSDKGWISSKISFELFFSRLTTLQVLINLKVGTKFTVSSASSEIVEVVITLLIKLSPRIGEQIKGNPREGLTIILRIASSITRTIRSLRGILKLLGRGLITLYGDILWLVSVLEGLELFFSKLNGGLEALIREKVPLDIALLLRSSSGSQLLVNLLLAIAGRIDLSSLSDLLNSVENLINLIIKLGGDSSSGETGVWKIVGQIIALTNGRIDIAALIQTLLEFAVNLTVSVDISISIKGLLKVIEIQDSRYSCSRLQGFVKIVKDIQSGKLEIRGINISQIITLLLRGVVGGALELVVAVLLGLSAVIKPAVAVPQLLLHLLGLLNSTSGVDLLRQVVPGISVSSENITADIFKHVNIVTILKLIASGFDISEVLKSVPILGQIYSALSHAISVAGKGSLNLKEVLKSSGANEIVAQIRTWFKHILSTFQNGGSGHIGGGEHHDGHQDGGHQDGGHHDGGHHDGGLLGGVTNWTQSWSWGGEHHDGGHQDVGHQDGGHHDGGHHDGGHLGGGTSWTQSWSWGFGGKSADNSHHDKKERHHEQHH